MIIRFSLYTTSVTLLCTQKQHPNLDYQELANNGKWSVGMF